MTTGAGPTRKRGRGPGRFLSQAVANRVGRQGVAGRRGRRNQALDPGSVRPCAGTCLKWQGATRYHVIMHDGITDPSSAWDCGFVSGLVCGEGNFTIAIPKVRSCRLGYHVRPVFQVELSVVDELLIRQLLAFFGFGSVSYCSRIRSANESATIRWSVTAMADCRSIESFFLANPLIGAKGRAFEIWRRCLSIIQQNKHTSTEGFLEIVSLREEINQNSRPRNFRNRAHLEASPLPVLKARLLKVWTVDEKELVARYIELGGNRAKLIQKLGRSEASVATQITRQRKTQT